MVGRSKKASELQSDSLRIFPQAVGPRVVHAGVVACFLGSCQNYGPFLGTLNNRCRIIIGTQKRTLILTTTHMLKTLHPELAAFRETWSSRHPTNPQGNFLSLKESGYYRGLNDYLD